MTRSIYRRSINVLILLFLYILSNKCYLLFIVSRKYNRRILIFVIILQEELPVF